MYKQPLAPSNDIANELREEAIKIWKTYDDRYGYATEKINKVKSIKNYSDDIMIVYRMFDNENQTILRGNLSEQTLKYINDNK